MLRSLWVLAPLLTLPLAGAGTCPSGLPVAEFRLMAVAPEGGAALPIQSLNHLPAGTRILYFPTSAATPQKGELSLLVAASSQAPLRLLESKPAAATADWTMPFDVSLAAVVWGPEGLDRGKIEQVGGRDREVLNQLARYAEQTAQTEALLRALSDVNRDLGQDLDVAVRSFATQYGTGARLNRAAPPDEQTLTLLRAVNPALATYDPLRTEPRARLQQSASLAASVAGLFFGSTVGLGAGGAALLTNLHTLLFPRLELRSSFAQLGGGEALTLCAKHAAPSARTRPAYLWARSFPGIQPPAVALTGPASVPLGSTSRLAVTADSALLDRVRHWQWVTPDGRRVAASVLTVPGKPVLDAAFPPDRFSPGRHQLEGIWDWNSFATKVEVEVRSLPDLKGSRLARTSKPKLIAGRGKVTVDIEGADFEFVDRVEQDGASATFRLPKGLRGGPQSTIAVELDTTRLAPGPLRLAFIQAGGDRHEIVIPVRPEPPKITNVPVRLNVGERSQAIALSGERLDAVTKVEADGASLTIESQTTTQLRVRGALAGSVKPGDKLPVWLYLDDLEDPVSLPSAIDVVGPRPRVTHVRPSRPAESAVALKGDELGAHAPASFGLTVANVKPQAVVDAGCDDASTELGRKRVRVGGRVEGLRAERSAADSLYVVIEPGLVGQPGCRLVLRIGTEPEGNSDPVTLGRVVRIPRITRFRLTDEKSGDAGFIGLLEGSDLEWIEQVGWSADSGLRVTELPAAASGGAQTLSITMPWPAPAPHAPLYLWLRGETEGRKTTVRW